jgi:signal transduction histidine kinase
MTTPPQSRIFAEGFSQLTSAALQYKNLHDIVGLLKGIAKTVNAYGCILWIEDPSPYIKKERSLYVFADWFSDEIKRPIIELPLRHSANGKAILSGQSKLIDNLQTDPETYKEDVSLKITKLTSMCVIPINFDSEKPNASLSVYRRKEVTPFTLDEHDFIHRIANMIPALYQAICDKVGRRLLSETHKILDNAERRAKEAGDDTDEIITGLQKVCDQVGNTFNCLETSIFLKNRLEDENLYRLFATTFPEWDEKAKTLSPKKEEGLTGWILEKRKPIRIFNLARFQEEKKDLRKTYKEIDWKDSLKIGKNARRYIDLPTGSLLPPLSFMAMPILRDQDLIGVIRCCTAKKSPWFFSEGQSELLEIVTTYVSRYWSDWLQYLEDKAENATWQNFILKISALNAHVHQRIQKGDIDENDLYLQIIDLANESISQEGIIDIVLADDKQKEQFPRDQELAANSLGETDNFISLEKGDTEYLLHRDHPSLKLLSTKISENEGEVFTVPIDAHDTTVGFITIRSPSNKPLLPNARSIAELIGQQLGLYVSLGRNEKQQRQVFEDLWHQLKSPIGQTFTRMRSLVQSIRYKNWHPADEENVESIRSEVLMLKSIARKAQRVAVNAGVFTVLSREGQLNLKENSFSDLSRVEAQRILTEGYQDTEKSQDDFSIKYLLDTESLAILETIKVKVVIDLLEQAISCLLDNTNKYTEKGTPVIIECGAEEKGDKLYFYISISNHGIEKISENDIAMLKERGYRGPNAKLVTGEGSGIGLWVVDHIMRAHRGNFEIVPTTKEGLAEMKLLFPVHE